MRTANHEVLETIKNDELAADIRGCSDGCFRVTFVDRDADGVVGRRDFATIELARKNAQRFVDGV